MHHSRHNKITHAFSLLFIIALAFSLACTRTQQNTANTNAAALREVTDDAGKRLSVPARVERVVSLAPNLTEIVYAVGAGNRLVGNTTYCNYPPEANAVAKVGDTLQPNIERIIALRPQLVLVSTASQLETFTRQMDEQRIPVYVTDPKDLEGVFRSVERIGELLGESERAASLANELRVRANRVEEAVRSSPPVSVFYQVSRQPLYTTGRDSFITDLIRRAGGKSVTADVEGAYPRLSDEAALAAQPEAVVMATDDSMGAGNKEVADALKNSPAVKQGRVYGINGDYLSRPGPRLVEGLEQMARVLHPEAFK